MFKKIFGRLFGKDDVEEDDVEEDVCDHNWVEKERHNEILVFMNPFGFIQDAVINVRKVYLIDFMVYDRYSPAIIKICSECGEIHDSFNPAIEFLDKKWQDEEDAIEVTDKLYNDYVECLRENQ